VKGWYAPGLAALALVAAATQGSAAEVHAGDSEQNWEPSEVHVKPGEQVTWTFENPNMVHNVESSTPNWSLTSDIVTNHPPVTYTFTAPGTYGFICHVHGSMVGTVIVDGDATPAPTPTVTPTVTPTQTPVPTATATPVPPAPVVTLPAPTPVATPAPVDRTRPTVTALKLSAVRHGAKVRFKLSEAATVTIKGTRGSKTLKTATVRAKAGTRTVTLRASKITPGRLTVEVQARDEAGNRSASARRALTIRR
jgi:plastocyanin